MYREVKGFEVIFFFARRFCRGFYTQIVSSRASERSERVEGSVGAGQMTDEACHSDRASETSERPATAELGEAGRNLWGGRQIRNPKSEIPNSSFLIPNSPSPALLESNPNPSREGQ